MNSCSKVVDPSDVEENLCFICQLLGAQSISDVGSIVEIKRGLETLKQASGERNDGLLEYLNTREVVYAHKSCRQKYINQKYIRAYKKQEKQTNLSPPKKRLRSSSLCGFDWETLCFICGEEAIDEKEKKRNKNVRRKIHLVNNKEMKSTILELIKVERDDYCREIHKRISGVIDLVALKARYHGDCYLSLKNSVHKVPEEKKKIHPQVLLVDAAMKQIYQYIEENEDCQFSMQELKNIPTLECIPDEKTIKARLISQYKDDIIFSSKFGANMIICFRKKHHEILSNAWYNQREENETDEEYRILKAAGEIIRRHIRTVVVRNDQYPPSDKMFEDINASIPPTLLFILSEIIMSDKKSKPENAIFYEAKCSSIAHAIMSAVRPRSFISPLQIVKEETS